MLNLVRLESCKAWREADLMLGKVTGFFGTNSAGNSSLLQFLLLLTRPSKPPAVALCSILATRRTW